MDAKETEVASAGAGAVDAAALAKAALATVMGKTEKKVEEKVDIPNPTVEQLQAELAALKAKMGTPAAAKPSKEDKAATKAAAKAAAAQAKADAKAAKLAAKTAAKEAKAAAKATKPDKAAAKAAAKAASDAKKAEKLAAKEAAAKAKADAKAAKLAAKEAKKTAKAEKKTAKSDKPVASTGQGGPAIKDLTAEDLNDKETAILLALGTEGHRTEKTIKALADECFPNKKKAQANSWTRNGLRRLVRAKFLEKEGRGVFKQTVDGRNVAKKLEELKSAKK